MAISISKLSTKKVFSKEMILKNLKLSVASFSSLGSLSLYLSIMFFLLLSGFLREFLILLCIFLLQYILGLPIRANFFKKRVNPKHHAQIYEKNDFVTFSSFPSFHATRIVALSWIMLSFFSYAIEIIFFSITLVLLVSLSRIILQRHYFTDIVGGLIFGSLLWLISSNIVFIAIA